MLQSDVKMEHVNLQIAYAMQTLNVLKVKKDVLMVLAHCLNVELPWLVHWMLPTTVMITLVSKIHKTVLKCPLALRLLLSSVLMELASHKELIAKDSKLALLTNLWDVPIWIVIHQSHNVKQLLAAQLVDNFAQTDPAKLTSNLVPNNLALFIYLNSV